MSRSSMWGALGLVAFCAGCGDPDAASLVPVSGTVTLNGKGLEGVTITFVPDPANKPNTAGGDLTGPGGSFHASYRNHPGLAPGKYKVCVSPPLDQAKASAKSLPADIQKSPFMAGLAAGGGGPKGPVASNPAEAAWPYGDATKTPLSHEVKPQGETGVTFELKSSAATK